MTEWQKSVMEGLLLGTCFERREWRGVRGLVFRGGVWGACFEEGDLF
jgi:hypothetical protein